MKKLNSIMLSIILLGFHGAVFAQAPPGGGTGGDACGGLGQPACSVPEPGVYLLLLSGLIGLGVVKYLKKRK